MKRYNVVNKLQRLKAKLPIQIPLKIDAVVPKVSINGGRRGDSSADRGDSDNYGLLKGWRTSQNACFMTVRQISTL